MGREVQAPAAKPKPKAKPKAKPAAAKVPDLSDIGGCEGLVFLHCHAEAVSPFLGLDVSSLFAGCLRRCQSDVHPPVLRTAYHCQKLTGKAVGPHSLACSR